MRLRNTFRRLLKVILFAVASFLFAVTACPIAVGIFLYAVAGKYGKFTEANSPLTVSSSIA